MNPVLTKQQRGMPDGVVASNKKEVTSWLKKRAALSHLVHAIIRDARIAFGPDAELCLEIYRDPEIDDRHLVLYVRLDPYPPDVIDRIEAICAPFQQVLGELPDYFLVTTDFRRPGEMNGV